MSYDNVYKVVDVLFESSLSRYQIDLENQRDGAISSSIQFKCGITNVTK